MPLLLTAPNMPNNYDLSVQYYLAGEGLDLPLREVDSLLTDYIQAGYEPVTDPAQTAADVIVWMTVDN